MIAGSDFRTKLLSLLCLGFPPYMYISEREIATKKFIGSNNKLQYQVYSRHTLGASLCGRSNDKNKVQFDSLSVP